MTQPPGRTGHRCRYCDNRRLNETEDICNGVSITSRIASLGGVDWIIVATTYFDNGLTFDIDL